jgi:hypothetical protein
MLTLVSIYLINQREKIPEQFKALLLMVRRPAKSDS